MTFNLFRSKWTHEEAAGLLSDLIYCLNGSNSCKAVGLLSDATVLGSLELTYLSMMFPTLLSSDQSVSSSSRSL